MTDVLRILVAPLLWLAMFSGIYGLHGLLCGHGFGGEVPGGAVTPRVVLIAAYVLAIAAQVAVVAGLHSRRLASPSGFVRFVSRTTGWVGLAATVWTLMPVLTTSFCG